MNICMNIFCCVDCHWLIAEGVADRDREGGGRHCQRARADRSQLQNSHEGDGEGDGWCNLRILCVCVCMCSSQKAMLHDANISALPPPTHTTIIISTTQPKHFVCTHNINLNVTKTNHTPVYRHSFNHSLTHSLTYSLAPSATKPTAPGGHKGHGGGGFTCA